MQVSKRIYRDWILLSWMEWVWLFPEQVKSLWVLIDPAMLFIKQAGELTKSPFYLLYLIHQLSAFLDNTLNVSWDGGNPNPIHI